MTRDEVTEVEQVLGRIRPRATVVAFPHPDGLAVSVHSETANTSEAMAGCGTATRFDMSEDGTLMRFLLSRGAR